MSTFRSAIGRAMLGSIIVAGLLGCGLRASAGILATERAQGAAPQRTTYTPVVLRRHLTRAPAAWLGRIVWVRARAEQSFVWTCQQERAPRYYACMVRQPSLADPTVDAVDARLRLALPRDPAVLVRARHAPLVGPLIARLLPPTLIAWGSVGRYHIQLVAPSSCAAVTCVVAQVLATT